MKHIVSFSGGLGSAEALKQTVDKYGKDNVIALFADVKGSGLSHNWSFPAIDNLLHERFGGESRDLYRFMWELSSYLEIPVQRLEDGVLVGEVLVQRPDADARGLGDPAAGGAEIPVVDLDADEAAAEAQRGHAGRPRAHERIEHHLTGLGEVAHQRRHQR